MREILCHMFKAGFKSLRGIKIIKVFSLLLAGLWKNHKWLKRLCWSETTVGKWKESVSVQGESRGRRESHSYCSLSLRTVKISASNPSSKLSDTLLRGEYVCFLIGGTVALQCVSFYCPAKWISYANTYIPPFFEFPSHAAEHWVEFPVLYSRFSFIIYCSHEIKMLVPWKRNYLAQ